MNNILSIKWKIFIRSIFVFNVKSIVKFITYIIVISIFLLAICFIFFRIFNFLLQYEEIGKGLIYRIFSLMFSMIFMMLILSSIISSISTFFRTRELDFLFTMPIRTYSLFWIKLLENGIFSSWATALISLPLIFALGKVFNMGILFFIISYILLLIFVIISTSIGLVLVFLFSKYFLKYSKLSIILLFLLIIIVFVLMYLFQKAPDLFNMPRTANLQEINRYIKSLEIEQFRYLPSGILTQLIFNFVNNKFSLKDTMQLLLYLLGIIPFILFAMKNYKRNFTLYGQSFVKRVKRLKNRMNFCNIMFNNKTILLIQKDIILFFRTPSQWGQLLIFLTLLMFYVFSLIRSPIYIKTPFYTYIIAFANLGFTAYIAATLSVRFIFPLISLEGKAFDIIKLGINIKDFFNAKLLFNFVIILISSQLLVIITNMFLDLDATIMLLSVIIIFIFSIGITIINVGIGAILPDFTQNNPSKIASGFGGIISAIMSLVYVGVCLGILSSPTKLYFEYKFRNMVFDNMYFIIAIIIIFIITLIQFTVIYIIALRKLKKH